MGNSQQIQPQKRQLPRQHQLHTGNPGVHRMATETGLSQAELVGIGSPVHRLLPDSDRRKSCLFGPRRRNRAVQLRLPTEQQQKQTDRALLIVILISGSALALWLLLQ